MLMDYFYYDKYEIVDQRESSLGRLTIHLDTVKKDDRCYPYSFLKANDSICVLPIVDNKILLVKQYRHALKSWEFEIPGGGLEEGEDIEMAAARELLEETGYKADSIKRLGMYYPSPGITSEKAYLCVALCHNENEITREPLELITTGLFSISAFEEMIRSGDFRHGMGLVAWLKYKTLNILYQ